MKSLLPLCLIVITTPTLLTGCNRSGDMGATTTTDTNAMPATNAAPAMTDTNAAPMTTPAAADTNAPAPSAAADTNMAPAMTNTPPAAPSTNSGM